MAANGPPHRRRPWGRRSPQESTPASEGRSHVRSATAQLPRQLVFEFAHVLEAERDRLAGAQGQGLWEEGEVPHFNLDNSSPIRAVLPCPHAATTIASNSATADRRIVGPLL